jgi:repressor LexA
MKELTNIQWRVFGYVRDKLITGRSAPTLREIAVEFGWGSKRAAECHIEALIRKGWLASERGKSRSLHLLRQAVVVQIPLFGSIPAGLAQNREQESEGCISVDIESIGFKPTSNTFALRITGNSMIGKCILNGDIVVLEHGLEPRNGEVVAALIDGESTLKTFILKNGKPYLKAENSEYLDLIPAHDLMIQGVFRALIRKARE